MAHNKENFGMNEQKDLEMPLIKAFDKEKLLAMQKQVVEGMTHNGNSQQCISEPVKRQVAEAWKNVRTHGAVGSSTSGYQDQCHCCRHYGLPCRWNRSSKKEVKVTSNGVTNEDKKRKAKSLDPALGCEQHPNPMLSHLALNSSHENPNLGDEETSQANPTAHEVYIDGWTITYKEFQPRRINQFRKKVNQGQRADNTRSNTLVESDITKDPAKKSVITANRKDTM